jgi:hypothetical protein
VPVNWRAERDDLHVTALPAVSDHASAAKPAAMWPAWPWDDSMPVQVVLASRVADPGGSQCLVL